MLFGGSLSARRTGSRADGADEFLGMELDQRLPTSAHGSSLLAAEGLAALGVRPGRYSGVEQAHAAPSTLTAALEPTSCEVTRDGSLVMTSAATGEVTTFVWVMDRWRWSPQRGVSIEALPRRVGAVLVIDFLACEGRAVRPAGRCYLADANGLSSLNEDQIAERGARMARRDDRACREYVREAQRRQPGVPAARSLRGGVEAGCPAREMVLDQRGQATRPLDGPSDTSPSVARR